jgi:hypothetical protein
VSQAARIVNYFPKRPKPTPKVKAPFLIETKEWNSPTFGWLVDAGYVVSGLVLLRFNGKLKTCWVWALKGRSGRPWEYRSWQSSGHYRQGGEPCQKNIAWRLAKALCRSWSH